MASTAFDYASVDSYEKAIQLLVEHGDEAKILAGGQSLAPMLNLRLAQPEFLIDINGIPAQGPTVVDGMLRLPALTRHRTLLEHPLVATHAPLLAEAVGHVGNVRVRNRGTIGGSLAHCDPTAELGASALVLDAHVVACGPSGARTIPVRELFVTYLTTVLEPTEVITEVVIPVTTPGHGWSFHEMVRRTSDFAIVAVAARVDVDEQEGTIHKVQLALAGVDNKVVLVSDELLSPLTGESADDGVVARVSAQVAASVDPESDIHASGDYRRRLVDVLTRRALLQAYQRAKGSAAWR